MNELTKEEIDLLVQNKIIPEGTPQPQINFFNEVCKRKKLDPFLRQIYMVERKELKDDVWKKSYSIQTSLDGMRAISQRNKRIKSVKRGTKKIEEELYGWCEIETKDGGIYYDEVPFSEYVQKTRTEAVTHFWKQFPQTMIKKVAEESVRRMADPEDLSGLYGDTEMLQADNDILIPEKTKTIQMPKAIGIIGEEKRKIAEVPLSNGKMLEVFQVGEGSSITIGGSDIPAEIIEELQEGVQRELIEFPFSIQPETERALASAIERKKSETEKPEPSKDIISFVVKMQGYKKKYGEKVYYDILKKHGWEHGNQIEKGMHKVKIVREFENMIANIPEPESTNKILFNEKPDNTISNGSGNIEEEIEKLEADKDKLVEKYEFLDGVRKLKEEYIGILGQDEGLIEFQKVINFWGYKDVEQIKPNKREAILRALGNRLEGIKGIKI